MSDGALRDLERAWADGRGDLELGESLARALERVGADVARRAVVRGQLLARRLEAETRPEPAIGPLAFSIDVPGAAAVERWRQVRALVEVTAAYPLLVGSPDQFSNALRLLGDVANGPLEPVAAILAAAGRLGPADPAGWSEARNRRMIERVRATDPAEADRLEPIFLRPAQPAAPLEDDLARWPAEPPRPVDEFEVPRTFRRDRASGRAWMEPHDRVRVLLLPTTIPWHAAAYLRFGRFNECPPADEHVALHRSWFERYGAEPVGARYDVLEFHVARPPADRRAAVELAREQLDYCVDLIDHRTIRDTADLAARLLAASIWSFWWD